MGNVRDLLFVGIGCKIRCAVAFQKPLRCAPRNNAGTLAVRNFVPIPCLSHVLWARPGIASVPKPPSRGHRSIAVNLHICSIAWLLAHEQIRICA
jgi:hypothetical protein